MSQPVSRILVIVRRDQQELYARMSAQYRDVALVILDRRRSERRLQRLPVERDRRERIRRQPWSTEALQRWARLGYRLLYRAESIQLDQRSDPPPS
jgi:hypothetical protein